MQNLPPETPSFPELYDDLRARARAVLQDERGMVTLGPTALVHEAWLKLGSGRPPSVASQAHFEALAARAMRQVLVDRARARAALRRGGEWARVTLSGIAESSDGGREPDVLAVHEALEELQIIDPRGARVVECRWFAGMGPGAIAEALEVSRATVQRDLAMAQAWLRARLASAQGGGNLDEL